MQAGRRRFTEKPLAHLALIALLGLAAYSNTFHAPFQWDEQRFIVENPIVQNLNYFAHPSEAKGLAAYGAFKDRFVGYLTFALDYRIHGLDVTGYHVVNVAVHLFNAMLVYLMAFLTFETPFLRGTMRESSKQIALFSGLLFALHPLQTEAVTYIFQRLTSLVALFYLLSMVAYIGSRLSENKRRGYTLYALSLASAVLAMKTKENAFTLPIVIACYELMFFRGQPFKRLLRLAPYMATLAIIPLTLADTGRPVADIVRGIGFSELGYTRLELKRSHYLFTQLSVVVTYLRLLLLPINQNIDYDYPLYISLLDARVFLSALSLLSLLGLSTYLYIRSRRDATLRVVSFGTLWFFVALSVESSVIPIPMLINEYRAYLPSAGVFMAATAVIFLLAGRSGRKSSRHIATASLVLVSLMFMTATYARNALWRSEISLWGDVVSKSPHKARGYNNLADAYLAADKPDETIRLLKKALTVSPYNAEIYLHHYGLALAYERKGLIGEAIEQYRFALNFKPDFAPAHRDLALAYIETGQREKAIEHLRDAIEADPRNDAAYNDLAVAYIEMGLANEARNVLKNALRIDPRNEEARKLMDVINSSNMERRKGD